MHEEKCLKMVDGTEIFYEIFGSGFPLILLHGNGQSGDIFHAQVPSFQRFFKCFVIDSRNHGRSNNRSRYLDFAMMARDVIAIMDAQKIDRAHILGFSDGANIAMFLATRYPNRVGKLILNAGNLTVDGMTWLSRVTSRLEVILARFFKRNLSIKKLLVHDIGLEKAELTEILSPTLVLVGQFDLIKRQHSQEIATLIPHARFLVEKGVGHLFYKRQPVRYNQVILGFLLGE
ncbi:hydrolase [Lactococcus hodotermopsidis]|uniref:Hydrolase n=1 Tax=Pseudolactococcus hodotermopsidis TaxID=2709157 RepID=A0A6A0BDW0_9LACT|nr:alpha/beta hydrolase [Lactococcus hodotermopsidis]GFH42017.1 hydrolase [Lactococcus hodotermopsidis]